MSVEVHPSPSYPSQTVAALSAACLVAASAVVPVAAGTAHSVPVLAPPSISLTALPLPLELVNQQVMFNTALFIDWVTTGAALVQRQLQVPGALVADLRAGVPPQTAAARALTAIADIEFEAGRDLIGYAQDIAVFQLQFRATTLSAIPPFNNGPGQQFVVDTTAFGLKLTQQLADFARGVVTSVEQFTHNALHTPLPLTATTVTPTAAIDTPNNPVTPKAAITLKTPTAQQDSAFSPKLPKLPKPPAPKFSAPKFSVPKFSAPKFTPPKVHKPQPKGPSKD